MEPNRVFVYSETATLIGVKGDPNHRGGRCFGNTHRLSGGSGRASIATRGNRRHMVNPRIREGFRKGDIIASASVLILILTAYLYFQR